MTTFSSINAHNQKIVDLFGDAGDDTVFKILIRIDPDRTGVV